MLFSQGFRTAGFPASKIVPSFNLCDKQLSPQPHYDFGLRASRLFLLVLVFSGGEGVVGLSDVISEQVILTESVTEIVVPKLVADDVPLLARCVLLIWLKRGYFSDLRSSLLTDVLPGTEHDFTTTRALILNTLFSLIDKIVRNIIEYNMRQSDFPLSSECVEQYVTKRLLLKIIRALSVDGKLDFRAEMGDFLRKQTGIDLTPLTQGYSLLDYDLQINNGEWTAWQSKVPVIEIEPHAVTASDVVVPTVDTVRHEEVLYSWVSEHKPPCFPVPLVPVRLRLCSVLCLSRWI